jgi:hypothetical protein
VLHVDESPTKEGTSKAWVWTFVARRSRNSRRQCRNVVSIS